METQSQYVWVGVFVIGLVLTLGLFLLWASRSSFGDHVRLYDIFITGSVSGLKEGNSVRYRGLPVGTVRAMDLDPNQVERIRVTVAIDSTIPIKEDAVASLEMQGITGQVYVQISGNSQGAQRLLRQSNQRYPVIKSSPSRLEEVVNSAPEAIHKLVAAVNDIRALFSPENRHAFSETLKSVQAISKALAGDGKATDIAQTMRELRTTLTEFNLFFKESRPYLADFAKSGLGNINNFFLEARLAAGSFTRVADHLDRSPSRFFFGHNTQGVVIP